MHFNELLFKAISHLHDGKTSGPKTTSGPIGKAISNIRAKGPRPMANFKAIPGVEGMEYDCDEDHLQSNDARYFYRICHLVRNGPEEACMMGSFDTQLPGELSNARWLTTASSDLYEYTRSENPSEKLFRICNFIINCYAPLFFKIKQDFLIQNGARHYFLAVKLARDCCNPTEWKEVKKTFLRNSYMATSEYILLAGIFDDDRRIRLDAHRYIQKARRYQNDLEVRKYELPKKYLKLDSANHYFELLDFDTIPLKFLTPPPLLQDFSNDDILKAARGESVLNIPEIPCHSQNCERAVAATTLASKRAIGQENRHQFLLNLEKNRQLISTDATKKNFTDLL